MNYYIKSLLYSVVIIKLSKSEVNIQLESEEHEIKHRIPIIEVYSKKDEDEDELLSYNKQHNNINDASSNNDASNKQKSIVSPVISNNDKNNNHQISNKILNHLKTNSNILNGNKDKIYCDMQGCHEVSTENSSSNEESSSDNHIEKQHHHQRHSYNGKKGHSSKSSSGSGCNDHDCGGDHPSHMPTEMQHSSSKSSKSKKGGSKSSKGSPDRPPTMFPSMMHNGGNYTTHMPTKMHHSSSKSSSKSKSKSSKSKKGGSKSSKGSPDCPPTMFPSMMHTYQPVIVTYPTHLAPPMTPTTPKTTITWYPTKSRTPTLTWYPTKTPFPSGDGSRVFCPGKDPEDYCDCAGDCGVNQNDFCECEEAQVCCESSDFTDGYMTWYPTYNDYLTVPPYSANTYAPNVVVDARNDSSDDSSPDNSSTTNMPQQVPIPSTHDPTRTWYPTRTRYPS